MPEWFKWLITILLILLLLLLAWLANRKLSELAGGSDEDSDGSGSGDGSAGSDGSQQPDRQRSGYDLSGYDPYQERRELAKTILQSGDSLIVKHLLGKVGLGNMDPDRVVVDKDLVHKIAREVPEVTLRTLKVAATQRDIEMDVAKTTEMQPVEYPTVDMELEQVTDLTRLPEVLPEQQMLDDEQYYYSLANSELLNMQSYNQKDGKTILYIVYDVSTSMRDETFRNLPRHIWGRGVTINLLAKAVRGEAIYFLLPFSGQPHKLRQARDANEAESLIDTIETIGFSESGTNIQAAINQAVKDIRSQKGDDIEKAEILLISDAEDDHLTVEGLQEALGDDIRLHAALIGTKSDVIREVATTYYTLS